MKTTNESSLPARSSALAPVVRPIQAFLASESPGAVMLMAGAIIAIVWANSPWGAGYDHFWHKPISIGVGDLVSTMSIGHWVNDGLMVLFFLLVGLEIKRELVFGELSSLRKAAFPISGAIGGMIVPALLYAAFNARGPGSAGWGVPMATDIAFAVGVLMLTGRSVPTGIRVFLLALAIVDDLGAVLVIAFFYTSDISMPALGIAGAFLLALIGLNLLRVNRVLPYLVLGVGLWIATLNSGIHATIAGVLLAFTIPASRRIDEMPYVHYVREKLDEFERDTAVDPNQITENQSHALKAMEEAAQAVQTPLAQIEHALLRPVAFVIIPIFALANAGVDLRAAGAAALTAPITWGILLGLFIGKPLGVLLAAWLAIRTGLASLPEGTKRGQLLGVAFLCGIGFTMSLFVANLAFPNSPEHIADTKIGILLASILSGVAGAICLRWSRGQAA